MDLLLLLLLLLLADALGNGAICDGCHVLLSRL